MQKRFSSALENESLFCCFFSIRHDSQGLFLFIKDLCFKPRSYFMVYFAVSYYKYYANKSTKLYKI